MKNLNTCTLCGSENVETFELNCDGVIHDLCEDCAEAEGFVRCAECGEWVHESDAISTSTGEYICEDCYGDSYFTCEECGEVHHFDEAVRVDPDTRWEQTVCEDCADRHFYRCGCCNEYFSERRHAFDSADGDICEDCRYRYVECADCGEMVHESEARWDDDREVDLCDRCFRERPTASSYLHDYSYKPRAEFQLRTGEDVRETLTFGLEVEVDKGSNPRDLCDTLGEMGEPIYMKHDGSLSSDGVEIVTHPCSLAYHTYQLRWKAISKACISRGYRSHDTSTCGLHIHVGRAQMGDTAEKREVAVGNLVILLNALWGNIERFTRRTKSALSRWAERNNVCNWECFDRYDDIAKTNLALETRWNSAGRYQAINLENSATVEFRIFRGSLNRETIIASIQLVNNLTKFAMTHTPTECYKATWLDVLNVERFEELVSYCERMHLPT